MKYIKKINTFKNKPKIGDYVICKEGWIKSGQITKESEDADLINFLSNNIGKIVDANIKTAGVKYDYLIKYYDIPKNIYHYFTGNRMVDTRPYDLDEIVEFSKNEEDLAAIIISNKYNL